MILKDKIIVILGNTRFDSPIKATSLFIARNLSKDNKVFFIDYPFTLKDYFNKKLNNSKERQNKFSLFSDGLMSTDLPNLQIVITPPVLPINFLNEGALYKFFLKINEFIIGLRLKKILKSYRGDEIIYINSFNFHYPGISHIIKPKLTVYHCVDPMIIPYDMKHGIKAENELVKNSDLVICTSKALYLEKKELNKNSYFIPNGTDSAVGDKVLNSNTLVHKSIRDLAKPIIGYLGTIERRIDYKLVEEIALANPDKNFVFAGPILDNYVPESLTKIGNMHFLGAIPYEEVPQVIKGFDIAIIPFKKDKVSNTIFPIKLFEYLSAGKPVISSNFNTDLREFTDNTVSYCENSAEFNKEINDILLNEKSIKIKERQKLAQENTWEKRSEKISEIISSHLELVTPGDNCAS